MAARQPFVPREEQKVEALSTVFYEITMLGNCLVCWGLRLPNDDWRSSIIRNVVLEATLVHARILLEFLTTPLNKRQKDDVLSEDYGFRIEGDEATRKLTNDINKYLAHLTYARLDRRDKNWQSTDFELLICDCGEFLRSLEKSGWVAKLDENDRMRWQDLVRRYPGSV